MTEFSIRSSYGLTGDQPEAIEALAEGCGAATATRRCSASRARARPSRWPTSSSACSGRRWSSRTTRPWRPSSAASSGSSSPTTRSSTSSATTTTTSPRPTSRAPTPTSRRTRRSTTRSTGCATPRPGAPQRRDVIIVASRLLHLRPRLARGVPRARASCCRRGRRSSRDEILRKLVDIQYERNDIELRARQVPRARRHARDLARLRGTALRIEFFGDEVERIAEIDPLTGEVARRAARDVAIYPAKHFVTAGDAHRAGGRRRSSAELEERLAELRGRRASCSRPSGCEQRTRYDLEMMREIGYCTGIENYSRHLPGTRAGRPRRTLLLDYFPDDFLMLHRRVARDDAADRAACTTATASRKKTLVEYGFRLPIALDNRPLKFEEFGARSPRSIFVTRHAGRRTSSAHQRRSSSRSSGPPAWSTRRSRCGRPQGQIDDLMDEITTRVERDERVLVTTLTKRWPRT